LLQSGNREAIVMSDLASTVGSELADYFEKVCAKLHKWVEPFSDEQFWKNPFSYGNDIGHLVLHLTGNLNYYIGAKVAASGYVRDRYREFAEAARPSKEQVLQNFDRAIDMVAETVRKQSAEDWNKEYSAKGVTSKNRFAIVLDCAAHADHHVGQIINLSRELSRESSAQSPST
jgi:uncharacterized damage-inducible protein DinB